MKSKKVIKTLALCLAVSLFVPNTADVAIAKKKSKVKLSKKTVTLTKGSTKKVKLKGVKKGKVKWKVSKKSKNKVKIKAYGKHKNECKIKALKKGQAMVIAKYKKKTYKLKVKIKKKKTKATSTPVATAENTTATESTDGSQNGQNLSAVTTNTQDSEEKTATPEPTAAPCEHSYQKTSETPATYENAGETVYTCSQCGDEYTETISRLVDSNAPTGEIKVSQNVWKTFLNKITFNLFFKETQTVEITAEDNESGVKEIAYFLNDSEISEKDIAAVEWTSYENSFTISPNQNVVIYAKITDKQDNVAYISSDGIVLTDTPPVITSLEDGGSYYEGQQISIQDGETLKINDSDAETSQNTYTFNTVGEYKVTVTDEAGNETSVTIKITHKYTGPEETPATYENDGFMKYVCEKCGDEYTEPIPKLVDNTEPSGKIAVSGKSWNVFSDSVSFDTYFNDTQNVKITAEDNESGVKEIAYCISESKISKDNLADAEWTAYEDSFDVSPNKEIIIYAKITDKQNNVTYINSSGIVLDNVPPTIDSSLEDGGSYEIGTTITVQDGETLKIDGSAVKTTNNTYAFNTAGEYEITVSDKAGNEAGIAITIEKDMTDAGLYTSDGRFISWDTLVNSYKMDVTADYTNNTYASSSTSPYKIMKNNNLDGDLVLPDSVVKIGEYAFFNNTYLTSVRMQDSVTSLGACAFASSSIKSVKISKYLKTIPKSAFSSCNKLTKVTLGNGTTTINDYAFKGCTSLFQITIPSSVTSIGTYAFNGCSSLVKLTIPSGITKISDYTFYGCSSLAEITIPSSVTSIGTYAFNGCSSLTEITIPSGVTSIKDYTFYGCSSLTEIEIPSSVTSIGTYAFYGCSSATKITIPNGVTVISDSTFYGCSLLTEITIPSGVTSIGNSAFKECTSLTEITIPSGVTSIGTSTFSYCSSLTGIIIPSNVTSIGNNAFFNCSSLTEITIPSRVTSIGSDAFNGCSSAIKITIPSGVTSIGGSTFSRCSSVTEIIIPSRVTSIGNYAFQECTSLTEITIPSSVTSIGNSAFYKCSSATKITIPSGVTSIGTSAFSYCSSLTEITIPSSVTSISDYTFNGCSSATEITIPSSVTSIGTWAFANCKGVSNIDIPDSVTSIGSYAFYNVPHITYSGSATGYWGALAKN